MPTPVFIAMNAFQPDGGAFGPELALVQNSLPVHGGWSSMRKKAVQASVADGPMQGYVHIYQQAAAIQKARPSSDNAAGIWVPSSGTNLYDRVNEAVPSDAEFIYAPAAPSAAQGILNLPALVDPASSSGHYIRWRYRIPSTTGAWTLLLELVDKTRAITSITRSGSTATVTTTAAHGLSTGQVVYHTGATQPEYNVKATITVTGASTYTFTVSGTPATPATGTPVYRPVWKTDTVTGTGAVTGYLQREATLAAGEANAINDYASFRLMVTATVAGAAAFGRPTSDIAAGLWTDQAGLTATLYARIDETPADDTDYLKSPILALGGAAYTYTAGLGTLEDPITNAGFTFRYRPRGSNAGVQLKARLKQGSTVIKETVTASLATSYATQAISLTPTEMAAVTDFAALQAEFEASYPAATTATIFQYARPISDTSSTGWVPTGSSDRFATLDEASPSDADYVQAGSTLANILEMSLSAVSDPGTDADHVLHIRASAPTSGNSLQVDLYGPGLIKHWDSGNFLPGFSLTGSLTTFNLTLTAGEASLITDYTQLRVKLTAYGSNGGLNVTVSWLELAVPERRWAEVSFAELESPSPARAEVSWMEAEVPDVAQVYKGDVPTIIAGSKTKLYEVTSSAFTDISKGGGYGTGAKPGVWRFASFGNDVIATNRADSVQYRAGNTGNFADLITSTAKPLARFVTVIRNYVQLGDINLAGYYSDQVWWSAIDDARTFVDQIVTARPETQSDQQRIVSRNGALMGMAGGDQGVIFKRNSMHLQTWLGGTLVFRFDDISSSVGTPYPSSIVQTPYGLCWFDGSTFRRYLGGQTESDLVDIGSTVLSEYLTGDFSPHPIAQIEPGDISIEDQIMVGSWDPFARVVVWTYQDRGGTAFRHTRGIVYNPAEERWGTIYDPNLSSAYLCTKPNVTNSDTFLLKGTVGFDWSGTTTSWFRFDGATTYEMTFQSKRQALGIEEAQDKLPTAARITGVLPVFSTLPEGAAIPRLSVLVEGSNDPFFATSLRSKTVDTTRANSAGWMPADLAAFWFRFTVTCPEMTAQQARAFKGLYLTWDYAGTPGSL